MAPVSVSVPPEMVNLPPVPPNGPSWITPPKLSFPAVMFRVLAPRSTVPEPDRLLMELWEDVCQTPRVPLSTTFEDVPIEPDPTISRSAPESIVVWPV